MITLRFQLAGALFLAGATATSADVCVSCEGPSATYLCAVKRADDVEALAGAGAVTKICLKVLKKNGPHASCQVMDVAGGSCAGVPTAIGWREVKDALTADDPVPAPASKTKPASAEKAAPATKSAPAKVSEAADGKASKDVVASSPPAAPAQPTSPGVVENIKGAAEKTWSCVSSFFGKC